MTSGNGNGNHIAEAQSATARVIRALMYPGSREKAIRVIRQKLGESKYFINPAARKMIDYVLVCEDFDDVDFSNIAPRYYANVLASVTQTLFTEALIEKWIDTVREGYLAHVLLHNGLKDALKEQKPSAVLATRAHELAAILSEDKQEPDMAATFWQNVELWRSGELAKTHVQTGYRWLDANLIGGLPRGGITMLGGPSGEFKSGIAGCIAANVAERGGGVMMFPRDMSKDDFYLRLVSRKAQVDMTRIVKDSILPPDKRYNSDVFGKLKQANVTVAGWPIAWQDNKTANAPQLLVAAKRAAAKFGGLDLIVFDYARLFLNIFDGHDKDLASAYTRFYSEMASYFSELNAALLVIHQFNRESAHRSDPRPRKFDAIYGGVDAAYNLFSPWRPWNYREQMNTSLQDLYGIDNNELDLRENDDEDTRKRKMRKREELKRKVILFLPKVRMGESNKASLLGQFEIHPEFVDFVENDIGF